MEKLLKSLESHLNKDQIERILFEEKEENYNTFYKITQLLEKTKMPSNDLFRTIELSKVIEIVIDSIWENPAITSEEIQIITDKVSELKRDGFIILPLSLESDITDEEHDLSAIKEKENFHSDYANVTSIQHLDIAETCQFHERLKDILHTLSEREIRVLELRYGINDSDEYTYDEIAKLFDRSRERISQIEKKAIKKLRMRYSINSLEMAINGFFDDDTETHLQNLIKREKANGKKTYQTPKKEPSRKEILILSTKKDFSSSHKPKNEKSKEDRIQEIFNVSLAIEKAKIVNCQRYAFHFTETRLELAIQLKNYIEANRKKYARKQPKSYTEHSRVVTDFLRDMDKKARQAVLEIDKKSIEDEMRVFIDREREMFDLDNNPNAFSLICELYKNSYYAIMFYAHNYYELINKQIEELESKFSQSYFNFAQKEIMKKYRSLTSNQEEKVLIKEQMRINRENRLLENKD